MRKYISSMFSWHIISTLQLHEMMMITDNLTIFPKLGFGGWNVHFVWQSNADSRTAPMGITS